MGTEASNHFSRRTGRALAAVVAVTGISVAVGVIAVAASGAWKGGKFVALLIIAGFSFGLLTTLGRWLLTKSARRIYLMGYYPFALGLMKLIGFIAVTSVLLFALVAAVVEPSWRKWLFDAVVLGFVQFAIIALFADGLGNGVIISRHLKGTLAETSRERRSSRASLQD